MTIIRNLAAILVRPRQTMRRILDQPADRMVLPLLLLAALSGTLKDLDLGKLRDHFPTMETPGMILMIVAINLAVALVMVLLFYGLSWVAALVGRMFEGQGTVRQARSALAWGLSPVIWALLVRLPRAVLLPGRRSEQIRVGEAAVRVSGLDFSDVGLGCALALVEVVVLVWYLVVASNTLAEAHRFSAGRGFATLLLTLAAPLIVLVAAVLAIAT